MADIVQRGLNLQVEAEDLASDVFRSVADELDQLQAKAEDVFGAIGRLGEDAGSQLADAAGMFAPAWESELQGLADFASTVFAGLEQSAAVAGAGIADASAPIGAAWQGAAAEMSGALDGAAGRVTGSAETIQGALDGIDGALSGLAGNASEGADGISTALDDAAGAVNGSAEQIAAALDPVSGALAGLTGDATAGADGIASALDDAAGSVSGSADTIAASLDPISGALTALPEDAAGAMEDLSGALDDAAGSLSGAADTVAKALDPITTTIAGVTTKVDAWPEEFKLSLSGVAGAISDEAPKIEAALGKIDTTIGDSTLATAGLAGPGVGGKGEKGKRSEKASGLIAEGEAIGRAEGEGFIKSASKYFGGESSGSFFAGGGSKLFMGGIAATMMPEIINQLADAMEQVGGMQRIGGGKHPMTVSQALELQMLMGSVNINPQLQTRMIARFEKNLLEGTGLLTGLSANNPLASPESLGLGRLAANPAQVVLGGPTETMARLFALAHVTPAQLQKMNAMQQMQALFAGMEKIPTQSAQTAVLQELFGGGRGSAQVGVALLQGGFPQLVQAYGSSGAASTANMLAGVMPKNAVATAANLRMTAAGLSMGLETVGIELIPVLQDFTRVLAAATKVLADIGHVKLSSLPGDVSAVLDNPLTAGYGAYRLGRGFLRGKGVGGAVRRGIGRLGGDLGEGGDLIGGDLAGTAADILSRALGPLGIGAAVLANPDQTNEKSPAWVKAWEKLVAPHAGQTRFTSKQTIAALTQSARLFGLDPAAFLADSYAEASLNPHAYNSKSHATGNFQFLPSTWAADTKRFVGPGGLSFKYASNPYIASFIAAASMSSMGISGMKGQTALENMIGDLPGVKAGGGTGFEHPGKAGAAGDLSRGAPFLKQIEGDLQKAEAALNQHKPKIKTDTDQMLLALVTEAKKQGVGFTGEVDKTLTKAETYLRTHKGPFTTAGRELMQGLEKGLDAEIPNLEKQVRGIATKLENELRSALKTHSPSEMTAAIGADLMAGLGLGMQRGSPATEAVARTAAAGVVGALSSPASAAGSQQPIQIIVQLDEKTLVDTVLRATHQRTKLVARFN